MVFHTMVVLGYRLNHVGLAIALAIFHAFELLDRNFYSILERVFPPSIIGVNGRGQAAISNQVLS